jgi:hypothetical protein
VWEGERGMHRREVEKVCECEREREEEKDRDKDIGKCRREG